MSTFLSLNAEYCYSWCYWNLETNRYGPFAPYNIDEFNVEYTYLKYIKKDEQFA